MHRIALISFHGCPVVRLGERDTGGMNVYVLQTAKELGHRGHKVDVYTRYHDPRDPQIVELEENVRVIHLKAGPYAEAKDNLSRYKRVFLDKLYRFQEAHDLEYDLIHSHYWLSGKVATELSRQWQVPHVTCFHTLAKIKQRARAGERETDRRIAGERVVMAQADAVVSFSRFEKEDVVGLYGVPPHKVHVIPAGVDLDMFKPVDGAAARQRLGLNGESVILYVGRIEPLKGIGILLSALAQMEDRADIRLLIVGGNLEKDHEVARLRTMAQALGVHEEVSFIGTVPQNELPIYYSAANVCVLPSYYESFGLAALEAMACGTPVIASRVGGLQTIVKNGETGYLIPWRCPDPFVERLEMLLGNSVLQRVIGGAARVEAEKMSWSLVVDRLLDIYDSLAGASVASAAVG